MVFRWEDDCAVVACFLNQKLDNSGGRGMQGSWQRRHAIQIVAQLPEGIDDALLVLELARELVETFLGETHHHLRLVSSDDRAISSSVLSMPGNPSTFPK